MNIKIKDSFSYSGEVTIKNDSFSRTIHNDGTEFLSALFAKALCGQNNEYPSYIDLLDSSGRTVLQKRMFITNKISDQDSATSIHYAQLSCHVRSTDIATVEAGTIVTFALYSDRGNLLATMNSHRRLDEMLSPGTTLLVIWKMSLVNQYINFLDAASKYKFIQYEKNTILSYMFAQVMTGHSLQDEDFSLYDINLYKTNYINDDEVQIDFENGSVFSHTVLLTGFTVQYDSIGNSFVSFNICISYKDIKTELLDDESPLYITVNNHNSAYSIISGIQTRPNDDFNLKAIDLMNNLLVINWEMSLTAYKENEDERFQVDFDYQGYDGSAPTQFIQPGGYVERPADIFIRGLEFMGWYEDDQGIQKYDFKTPVYHDLTLYAYYREET